MNRMSRILVPLQRGLHKGPKVLPLQPSRHYLVPWRSWNPMSVMNETMKDMDRQFRRLERDMDAMLRDSGLPRWGQTSSSAIGSEFKPEVVTEGDKNIYRMNVYMGENFPPENIKVTQKDNLLTIEAKIEQKAEDGKSRVYQEVMRQFTLPEKVNLQEVKTILSNDGILQIEAPFPPGSLEEIPKPKEIPILKA